jgi:hypothetical protein
VELFPLWKKRSLQGEGSSKDESYEKAEALVVSSWEPEESETLDSSDSQDMIELWGFRIVSDQFEWFCGLRGGEHKIPGL